MTSDTADLMARVDALQVPYGQLALWALGQAGFVLKGGDTVAYVDPYLSNANGHIRRFPVPVDPSLIRNADLVFATHEHTDHADALTLGPLLAGSPRASLVTSCPAKAVLVGKGIDAARVVVPQVGRRVEHGALAYTAIPSAHYDYDVDEDGYSRALGFVIELNGVTVYHAGDTILVPQMLEELRKHRIDIAMLPINGRDFFREEKNIVGNLWPGEAVDLAVIVGAKVLIGMHNDLFDYNRVSPGRLFDELDQRAPRQRCHIVQPHELYLYAG
jgi:L-ascorbate 6-phosphate lactonase